MADGLKVLQGLRVVRGESWERGDEDGGPGHVGTITRSRESHSDIEVTVVWDNGNVAMIEQPGTNILQVVDTAPLGSKHKDNCSECNQPILGYRWRCRECLERPQSVDLCNQCYHGDKHNVKHMFTRHDSVTDDGYKLPYTRKTSKKTKLQGFFKGASVKNEEALTGTVARIVSETSGQSAVVDWSTGQCGCYKIGQKGRVDLRCTRAGQGYSVYVTHLSTPWKILQLPSTYGDIERELHGSVDISSGTSDESNSENDELDDYSYVDTNNIPTPRRPVPQLPQAAARPIGPKSPMPVPPVSQRPMAPLPDGSQSYGATSNPKSPGHKKPVPNLPVPQPPVATTDAKPREVEFRNKTKHDQHNQQRAGLVQSDYEDTSVFIPHAETQDNSKKSSSPIGTPADTQAVGATKENRRPVAAPRKFKHSISSDAADTNLPVNNTVDPLKYNVEDEYLTPVQDTISCDAAVVIAGHEPISSDELQLSVDDVVLNVRRVTDDKMEGYLRGHKGKFPAQNVYIRVLSRKEAERLMREATTSTSQQMPSNCTLSKEKNPQQRRKSQARDSGLQAYENVEIMPLTVKKEGSDQAMTSTLHPDSFLAKALHDFSLDAEDADYISFKADDVIRVLDSTSEWWYGVLGNRYGYFPSNFVLKKPKPTKRKTKSKAASDNINNRHERENQAPSTLQKNKHSSLDLSARGSKPQMQRLMSQPVSTDKEICVGSTVSIVNDATRLKTMMGGKWNLDEEEIHQLAGQCATVVDIKPTGILVKAGHHLLTVPKDLLS